MRIADKMVGEAEVIDMAIVDENKYTVNLICNNCDCRFKHKITKGISIETEMISFKCPYCNCETVRKDD